VSVIVDFHPSCQGYLHQIICSTRNTGKEKKTQGTDWNASKVLFGTEERKFQRSEVTCKGKYMLLYEYRGSETYRPKELNPPQASSENHGPGWLLQYHL
jgi:hypothetical protein